MNSSKSAYSNALANLSNSHYAIPQADIIKEAPDAGIREVGKTITTDFGNILLGHVATTSLTQLGKMGNQLGKLGINSSDAKILSKAIANGDRRKVGQMIARLGSKKVKLGIKKLTGKSLTDEELPDTVEEQIDKNIAEASKPIQISDADQSVARVTGDGPQLELSPVARPQISQRDPDFDDEEFEGFEDRFGRNFEGRDPQGTDSDFFAQMRGDTRPAPAQPAQEDDEEDDFQDAVEDQSKATADEVSDVSKVASTGEDVASGFEDATLLSTAADDTGVGLVLTAGLGLASLFTGLFLKSKKPKVVQPPLIAPNNFAIQAGLT